MTRKQFLLSLFPVPALLAGCSASDRHGHLLVRTDLNTQYIVALETQTTTQAFVEIARSQVAADLTVEFDRLPPGEYRLVVYASSNPVAAVFATGAFGVSTNGNSTFTLTTGLPV